MLPQHPLCIPECQAILEYIMDTFRFKESKVGGAFYRFIEGQKHGWFKCFMHLCRTIN